MDIAGFLRFAWPFILELGVALLLIWVISKLIIRSVPNKYNDVGIKTMKAVKIARFVIGVVVVIIFAVWFLTSAGINLIPRNEIDRRGLDEQNQQWEQRHTKP